MANDDRRARILETAGPVFAEKGYEGTTVREVCEKAGVNLENPAEFNQLCLEFIEAASVVS